MTASVIPVPFPLHREQTAIPPSWHLGQLTVISTLPRCPFVSSDRLRGPSANLNDETQFASLHVKGGPARRLTVRIYDPHLPSSFGAAIVKVVDPLGLDHSHNSL